MRHVPPSVSPSYQLPSARFDPRSGVLIMCDECGSACSRDLGHEGGYTEPSPA